MSFWDTIKGALPSPVADGESMPIFGSGSGKSYYDESTGESTPFESRFDTGNSGLAELFRSDDAKTPAYTPSSPRGRNWDYYNADLAKQYRMSQSTAYQEALSNTAYQRSVKDMQAAGLNPAVIFGAGNGQTANGVGYVSAAGGSGRSYGSAKSESKLFGSGMYNLLQLAAGAVGYKVTGSSSGYYAASSAARTLMSALNGFLGDG